MTKTTFLPLLSTLLTLPLLGGFSDVSGPTLEFDTRAEFVDNFLLVDAITIGSLSHSNALGIPYPESATMSTQDRPGRVEVAGTIPSSGVTAYYYQAVDLDHGPLMVSYYFKAVAATPVDETHPYSRIALGVSPEMKNLLGNSEAQVRLIKGGNENSWKLEVRDGENQQSTTGITLIDGDWYRLSLEISSDGGQVLSLEGDLEHFGPDGRQSASLVAKVSGDRISTVFFDNGDALPVYAGCLLQNNAGGAEAMDRFYVNQMGRLGFDFDAPHELPDAFSVSTQGSAGSYDWSMGNGLFAEMGCIDVNVGTNSGETLYSETAVHLDEGPATLSYFFLAEEYTDDSFARIALGLSPIKAPLLYGTEVQARIIKGYASEPKARFEIRGTSSIPTPSDTLTLNQGHWYRLVATFARVPGQIEIEVRASLWDYGPNGASEPIHIATVEGTRSVSTFFDQGEVKALYMGVLSQTSGGGAAALDGIQAPPWPAEGTLAPSQYGDPYLFTWQALFGHHYRLDAERLHGTVRSYPTPSKLGFNPDVTDEPDVTDAVGNGGVIMRTGRFSGDPRYYDFTGAMSRGPRSLDYAANLRKAERARIDLIWNLGQIKHDDTKYWALIDSAPYGKKAAYFKDLIYEVVCFTIDTLRADGQEDIQVYWEIGNEINSAHRFSKYDYTGPEAGDGINLIDNANDYLNYYLAPAVEAIRQAAADKYLDPVERAERVKILLGNVTFIRQDETEVFLEAILEGTVGGGYSGYDGQKGKDLVDILGLHYSRGTASVLDTYYLRWKDDLDGFWMTEELGYGGLGDYGVARLAFRFADYWADKVDWHHQYARLCYWGDDIITAKDVNVYDLTALANGGHLRSETTGELAERRLSNFFKDYPLYKEVAGVDYSLQTSTGGVEVYGLRADVAPGTQRRAYLIFCDNPYKHFSVDSLTVHGIEQGGYAECWLINVDHGFERINEQRILLSEIGQTLEIDFVDAAGNPDPVSGSQHAILVQLW